METQRCPFMHGRVCEDVCTYIGSLINQANNGGFSTRNKQKEGNGKYWYRKSWVKYTKETVQMAQLNNCVELHNVKQTVRRLNHRKFWRREYVKE